MDYVFDSIARKHLCFVITEEVEPNYILVLNVIRYEPLK